MAMKIAWNERMKKLKEMKEWLFAEKIGSGLGRLLKERS